VVAEGQAEVVTPGYAFTTLRQHGTALRYRIATSKASLAPSALSRSGPTVPHRRHLAP
jgi:hypothetical protein